ncbi:MAG: hypothetical protein GF313_14620 [Caldithrix sp.]|nr:hypothetical protein [Caldithrix sp.]
MRNNFIYRYYSLINISHRTSIGLFHRFIIILLLVISPLYSQDAQQPDSGKECAQSILEAQELYYNGYFDEAIRQIKPCLKLPIGTDSLKLKALKITAQALQAKDDTLKARKVTEKLLTIFPNYYPTIEQEPPQFVQLVEDVRPTVNLSKTKDDKPFYTKKSSWVYFGGAAILTAGLIKLLMNNNKSKDDKSLPQPPGWPE